MTAPTSAAAPMAAPTPQAPGPRKLLLLGAGPAHMRVLRCWANTPLPGVQITLVTNPADAWYAPRVAGFVAGHWSAEACQWALEPQVHRSGVHGLRAHVRALDTDARTVLLDDGTTLSFDWLSINLPGEQNREFLDASMPGAREHALFVHPLATFCTLWPQVLAMAQARPLRFTVVGAGLSGCEIAMALQHRLPQARVTLLTGLHPPLARSAPALQARVLHAMKKRKITVLQDRALGVTADTVRLGCGALLASDVTVMATGIQPPNWLARSGLAQDAQGRLALDEYQRSNSHPNVFVTGVLGSSGPQSEWGAVALAAGTSLARHLACSVAGQPLVAARAPSRPQSRGWQIVTCGGRSAMACGQGQVYQGAWVWWLARWRDQRWLSQLQQTPP